MIDELGDYLAALPNPQRLRLLTYKKGIAERVEAVLFDTAVVMLS